MNWPLFSPLKHNQKISRIEATSCYFTMRDRTLFPHTCGVPSHLRCLLYHICIAYFLCPSSHRATSTAITAVVSEGAVSGAFQTTAQSPGCRPHVEERGLQALPTRRTLPLHNAPFHRVPSQAPHKPTMRVSQRFEGAHTHTQAEGASAHSTHTQLFPHSRTYLSPYFINSDSRRDECNASLIEKSSTLSPKRLDMQMLSSQHPHTKTWIRLHQRIKDPNQSIFFFLFLNLRSSIKSKTSNYSCFRIKTN